MNKIFLHLFKYNKKIFLTFTGSRGRVGIEIVLIEKRYHLGNIVTWLNFTEGTIYPMNLKVWNQFYKNKLIFNSQQDFLPHWTKKQFWKFWKKRIKIANFGYSIQISILGIGYKFKIQNSQLQVFVGKSHIIQLEIPKQVAIELPIKQKDQQLVIFGLNKAVVKNFSATIRSIFPPEVYKGKGIRYSNELVILKAKKKN